MRCPRRELKGDWHALREHAVFQRARDDGENPLGPHDQGRRIACVEGGAWDWQIQEAVADIQADGVRPDGDDLSLQEIHPADEVGDNRFASRA